MTSDNNNIELLVTFRTTGEDHKDRENGFWCYSDDLHPVNTLEEKIFTIDQSDLQYISKTKKVIDTSCLKHLNSKKNCPRFAIGHYKCEAFVQSEVLYAEILCNTDENDSDNDNNVKVLVVFGIKSKNHEDGFGYCSNADQENIDTTKEEIITMKQSELQFCTVTEKIIDIRNLKYLNFEGGRKHGETCQKCERYCCADVKSEVVYAQILDT